MPEPKRKHAEKADSDLRLEGFESFFADAPEGEKAVPDATVAGEQFMAGQVEKMLNRFNELIQLSVDQRVETARIANQLIENQRQLIATQQILIKLMERSIDMTRHVTALEEKLPAVFEMPEMLESLRHKVAQLEGVELR